MIWTAGILVVGLLATWALTGGVRRYALDHLLLDVPNHRSSHALPMPRGGGASIAAVTLTGIVLLSGRGPLPVRTALALAGGGALVALVGWLDDRRGVPAGIRLIVHLVAAIWAVYLLDGFPALELGIASVSLGAAGSVVAILWIAWGTNLYNFMDGIDGIAASEAVTVGLVGAALLALAGAPDLAALSLLIGAAAGGFLIWNWAPAKIFMGDIGSGLLGFLFFTLAIASARRGAVPIAAWLLLLGAFIFDASITLLRRMARGERWYDAHRSHAYQRAVQSGASHAQVTKGLIALNVALSALAFGVVLEPRLTPVLLTLGVGLLAWVYYAIEVRSPMQSMTRAVDEADATPSERSAAPPARRPSVNREG